ncbi:MAG: hypothetical protein COB46_11510 [Rhodospirillaceae bacterium]|nr:MAG: hypothetical protein COB46_11510 [Rhodospirillaceae bacterium]
MIALQLHCHDEHSFEAWFKNEQACEAQAKIGLIECPYCGSTNISKTTDKRAEEQAPPVEQEDIHARAHEVAQQILEAVGKLRDYAEDNFEPTKAVSTKSEETQPVENATENDEVALDEDLTDVEGQPSGSFGSDRSD